MSDRANPLALEIPSMEGLARLLKSDELLDAIAERVADKIEERERRISPRILSDKEAAVRLHVSISTVKRMKRSGRIGSVETPKGRKVRECDLAEYAGVK